MDFEDLEQTVMNWANRAQEVFVLTRFNQELNANEEMNRYYTFLSEMFNWMDSVTIYLSDLPRPTKIFHSQVDARLESAKKVEETLRERLIENSKIGNGSLLNFYYEANANQISILNPAMPTSFKALHYLRKHGISSDSEVKERNTEFLNAFTDALTFGRITNNNYGGKGGIDVSLQYGMNIADYPYGGSNVRLYLSIPYLVLEMDAPIHIGTAIQRVLTDKKILPFYEELLRKVEVESVQ